MPTSNNKDSKKSKVVPKTGAKASKQVIGKQKALKQRDLPVVAPRKSGGANQKALDAFKKVPDKIAKQEMDLLCIQYPDAQCELDYDSPFQLLTAVILSAQTTDVNVNKVTKGLFKQFPDAKSLAEGDLDEIKNLVRSTGYYNAKATNIQNCAKALVEKFGGEVPQDQEQLQTLPGVGRKTANVVLGVCFNVPGWSVDTHVQRLSKRLGFTDAMEPEKIENDLQKLFAGQDWSKLSITLIWHGRRTCFARNPDCEHCPINHICPSTQVC
ncbi:MAG: endonuclease III [Candidatus Obscuribacterales bacterium]|nr:endonuclease III [Candidatus Obscuribacterales bacterium]